jgi:hypothetical protein
LFRARDQQWNLLGRIVEGRVALGDRVSLPTAYGPPFRGYDYLTADTMPDVFCLCVGNAPGEYRLLCPGVARSADA